MQRTRMAVVQQPRQTMIDTPRLASMRPTSSVRQLRNQLGHLQHKLMRHPTMPPFHTPYHLLLEVFKQVFSFVRLQPACTSAEPLHQCSSSEPLLSSAAKRLRRKANNNSSCPAAVIGQSPIPASHRARVLKTLTPNAESAITIILYTLYQHY